MLGLLICVWYVGAVGAAFAGFSDLPRGQQQKTDFRKVFRLACACQQLPSLRLHISAPLGEKGWDAVDRPVFVDGRDQVYFRMGVGITE